MKFSKKGDGGETSLLGGQRVPKYDPRPETYGVLDEASSVMGVARATTRNTKIRDILFSGNTFASESTLRRLMKTRKQSLLSSGDFQESVLETDKQAIVDYDNKLKSGEITIVGVDKFRLEADKVPYKVPIFKSDRSAVEVLKKRIQKLRETRDKTKHAAAMKKLDEVLRSNENTFPAVKEAVEAHATPGELGAAVMKVYGKWTYPIGV